MSATTKHILGDDQPKTNPWQEDRLGYAPYAKRIAQIVITLDAPNGYVIGLHGQWGSGKSTLINFIIAYLEKHNQENPSDDVVHIDFRPWIVSGHQDLIAAFFKVLSERIGPRDGKLKRAFKGAASLARGNTDNLVDAAATVALAIDPSGGTASRFVGGLTKRSINSTLDRFLEDPSLQAAYDRLREQLGRSKKRFFVTVDDIDRLQDEDVRAIMQMAKSIGRLPNVVYLLSYDREIVWQALDQGRSGPRFAEKIVQQEIELPRPSRNSLFGILDQEISFLVADIPSSARWEYLLRDGVRRWIRSPRDVVRLSNAVKFSWPTLDGEIDPSDFLAMEGIRLFDSEAFSWVSENRDFLFREGRYLLANDEAMAVAADGLKQRVRAEALPHVQSLLAVLFPSSSKWLKGREIFGGEDSIQLIKRRGVGHEDGYDAYFSLHPSSDAIPRAVIDDLMEHLEDSEAIERTIRGYLGSKNSRGVFMVSKLFEEIRVRFRVNPPAAPTQTLLDELFQVGEEIISIDWDGDMFQLSPRAQIDFLIQSMLERWGLEAAGHHLIEAFEKATSPAFIAEIYVDRGRELGTFKSTSARTPLILVEDFERLGAILLAKIEAAARDNTLADAPHYFDIIRSWKRLDNSETAKAWLEGGMAGSAEFMVKVGRGLVSYSLGAAERRYTMNDGPDPDLFDLEALVAEGKKHLLRKDLTRDQTAMLTEIVRGSEQLLLGRSSETTALMGEDASG